MHFRRVLVASTWLLATAAMAQTPPAASGQSDSWAARPASASSAGFRGHAAAATPASSPFKFKDRQRTGPADEPPPGANDKAAVMGTDRAWQNGRPPVNCAQTPMDATCRH
jgi:hypothetical protein